MLRTSPSDSRRAELRAGDRRTAQAVGRERDPTKVGRAETVLAGLKTKWRQAG